MDKKYCVYIHTFPNGKKYVGITSKNPNARWQNGTGYDKVGQPCMYNAIQKYGWETVKSEIIINGLTQQEAQNLEIELIKKYNTNKNNENAKGYNMTDGGDGVRGKGHSENVRIINRNRLLGKRGYDCYNSLAVICEDVEYPSITDFCEKNSLLHKNNKANTGLVVPWLKGTKSMPKKWFDKGLRYKQSDYITRCRDKSSKNMMIYDGIEFNSQKECAEYIGVKPSTLCCWLSGKNPIPKDIKNKGLICKSEYPKEIKLRDVVPKEDRIIYNAKRVYCYGTIYNSLSAMERNTDFKWNTVRTWLEGIRKMPEKHKGNIYYI